MRNTKSGMAGNRGSLPLYGDGSKARRPHPSLNGGRRSGGGLCRSLGTYIAAGACMLLLASTLYVGSNTPGVTDAANALRRLATGKSKDGARIHSDDQAAFTLFRTLAESASLLQSEDTMPLLLASVVGKQDETRSFLLRASASLTSSWNASSSISSTRQLSQHGAAAGSPPAADPLPLFVLSACKVWRSLSPASVTLLTPSLVSAVERIAGRVSPDGLYLLEGDTIASDAAGGGGRSAVVRTVRQAGAIAALRCASRALARPELAVTAAMLLRQLHTLYVPSADNSTAAPFYAGAAIVRAVGGTDGVRLRKFEGLGASELGSLLFFLDPADVPDVVIGRLAARVADMDTPAGLQAAEPPAGVSGSVDLVTHAVPWRVSPGDQAFALIGAVKHLAFINDREFLVRRERAREARKARAEAAAAAAAAARPKHLRRAAADGGEGEEEPLDDFERAKRDADIDAAAEEEYFEEVARRHAEADEDYGNGGAGDATGAEPPPEEDPSGVLNEDAIASLFGSKALYDEQHESGVGGGGGGGEAHHPPLRGGDDAATAELTMALLRRVIEVSARIAPLLEQLDRESTARSLSGELAAAVSRALHIAAPSIQPVPIQPMPASGDDGEGGGVKPPSASPAPSHAAAPLDPFVRLTLFAHKFTFPEYLIPLPPGDAPLNPSLAAPIMPAWSLLRSAALGRMLTSRAGEFVVKVVTRARNATGRLPPKTTTQPLPLGTAAAQAAAAAASGGRGASTMGKLNKFIELFYPSRGLRVVRRTIGDGAATAGAGAAAVSTGGEAVRAIEHVVLDALVLPSEQQHQQGVVPTPASPAATAAAGKGGNKGGAGPTSILRVPLRGDGHPLSLLTAVSTRFFRVSTEMAREFTKERLKRANRGDAAGATASGEGEAAAGSAPGGVLSRARNRVNAALTALRRRVVRPALDDILLVLLAPNSGSVLTGGPEGVSLAASFTWMDHAGRVGASSALEALRGTGIGRFGNPAALRDSMRSAGVLDEDGSALLVDDKSGVIGSSRLPGAPDFDEPPPPVLRPDVGGGAAYPDLFEPATEAAPAANYVPQANAMPVPLPQPDDEGHHHGGGDSGVQAPAAPIPVPVAAPLPFEVARAVRKEGLDAVRHAIVGAARGSDAPPEEGEAPPALHEHVDGDGDGGGGAGVGGRRPLSPAEAGEAMAAAENAAADAEGDAAALAPPRSDAAPAPDAADAAAAAGAGSAAVERGQPKAAPRLQNARAAAAAAAVTPRVNILDLYARLCPVDDAGNPLSSVPHERPWADACCGSAMADLVLEHADAPEVPVSLLPTFTCKALVNGAAADVALPCSRAHDDLCDCTVDFADEPSSAACAATGGVFKCPSRVLIVAGGSLTPAPAPGITGATLADVIGKPPSELAAYGYISASKVGDGVADCEFGEDEAPGAASAVLRPGAKLLL